MFTTFGCLVGDDFAFSSVSAALRMGYFYGFSAASVFMVFMSAALGGMRCELFWLVWTPPSSEKLRAPIAHF